MEKNYTYLVQCADGSLYCGWTNHLKERVEAHNAGQGAKYTKSRRPVRLVYYEEFPTKQEAMRREWAIKQLSRMEKLRLAESQTQPCRYPEPEPEPDQAPGEPSSGDKVVEHHVMAEAAAHDE